MSNIMENFFVITSNDLDDISDKIYGFVISRRGIFDQDNYESLKEEDIKGRGVYLIIQKKENLITIRQDINGSWGLYLYDNGKFWAISNSQAVLIDYLKNVCKLSLDEDYANHLILTSFTRRSYNRTIVKEVKLIDRNAYIQIDIKKKSYTAKYIDYHENSISLNSEEGIRQLDNWINEWVDIISGIRAHTDQVMLDLSGGMDSRMVLGIVQKSEKSLNDIKVSSYEDSIHTHVEDFQIASQIAKDKGFKLNQEVLDDRAYYLNINEIIEKIMCTKFLEHKELFVRNNRLYRKRFRISGFGGECIRSHNIIGADDKNAQRYSKDICEKMIDHNRVIEDEGMDAIGVQRDAIDIDDSISYYRNSESRSHFGKYSVEAYLSNLFMISPLIDPELYKIKTCTQDCNDGNLLEIMILVRYASDLLQYKFQGGRELNNNTIEYARKLSDRYPFKNEEAAKNAFFLVDNHHTDCDGANTKIDSKVIEDVLTTICMSKRVKSIFCDYFDEEIYEFARNSFSKGKFVPLRELNAIASISWALQEIEASRLNNVLTISESFYDSEIVK